VEELPPLFISAACKAHPLFPWKNRWSLAPQPDPNCGLSRCFVLPDPKSFHALRLLAVTFNAYQRPDTVPI
jgi:hypothetical protein